MQKEDGNQFFGKMETWAKGVLVKKKNEEI